MGNLTRGALITAAMVLVLGLTAGTASASTYRVKPGALHVVSLRLLSHHHARHQDRGPAPVVPTALQLSQSAAESYWGSVPCAGQVSIVYAPPSQAPASLPATDGVLSAALWAWTSFDAPDGPSDYADAPATYSACTITIDNAQWSPLSQSADFPDFCALIVHEYGHLFGHQDLRTNSPSSITYPTITSANRNVAPCVQRYPEGGALALGA